MSATLTDLLGAELALLLKPLEDAATDASALARLLERVGAAPDVAGGDAFVTAIAAVVDLRNQIDQLVAQPTPSFDGIAAVVAAAGRVFSAVRALSASGGVASRISGLGEDLIEVLSARYLRQRHPRIFAAAVLLGLVTPAGIDPPPAPVIDGTQLVRRPFSIDRFHLEKLSPLIQDPLTALRAEYGTLATADDAAAMAAKLFPRLSWFLNSFGLATRYGLPDGDESLLGDAAPFAKGALLIYFVDPIAGEGAEMGVALTLSSTLGIIVSPFGVLALSTDAGGWTLTLTATADVQAFAVGPAGFQLRAGAGTTDVGASFAFTMPPASDGTAATVIGSTTGTRLEIGGAKIEADLALSSGSRSLQLSAAVSAAALVIAAGDGDGFLQRVLPSDGLRATFDLAIQWSNTQGLSLRGGAGLDATIPVKLSFGPLAVPSIHVGLHADGGALTGETSATFVVTLGPVRALVDRAGIAARLAFPDAGGNLGLVDFGFDWKAPSGVGLTISAPGVTGGGYLGHAGNQYSGALDLSVCGVAVKAFGLVETQLPGGAPGYSALVVLSAEFSPSLQLGYGFTLDGVGGIVGIDRTLSMSNVEAAIWGHHFDGLLFPADPVTAAPSLMSAIDSYFPAADGRYLFGPLAKIGWGAGIMEALVGLVIELPEPIKLLLFGEIDVQVPTLLPQLVLHIDFAGGIDFGKQLAFFDATLRDSKIERFPIAGDLAFRYQWGDTPMLALAIGGFHPSYQPPANFPTLKRISLSIGTSGVQLEAQGYLALTSNTLQLGAKVEITAGTGSLNVHGFFSFDALVEWNPFAFTLDLSAGVDLRSGTSTLASVHLDGHVSGTAPWHVSGDASLSLLFFDVSVHFDKQWGDSATALPAVDPTPAVIAALRDASAWSATLPASSTNVTMVSKATDAGDSVLLEPAGGVRAAQRVVPLGQSITRFGGAPLAAPLTLDIDAPNVFGETAAQPATEEFALAQFEDMSDQQKLSLPSFTRLRAGVTLGDTAVDLGQSARTRSVFTTLAYETTVIDSVKPRPGPVYGLTLATQAAMNARLVDFATPPSPIGLAPEQYIIAGTGDLKARTDISAVGSKRDALAALDRYVAENPAARGQLQVVLVEEAA